jgi:hypothetical protein
MMKTAEINSRLLEDLPVVRLPKFVPPGGGLSIWWMGDDRITFQAISSDTAGAYAFLGGRAAWPCRTTEACAQP